MLFNQKLRKPIVLTTNSSKNLQGYCQPSKESVCYNLPLYQETLKLAFRTHSEWILNRDKKHNEIYQKKN